MTNSKNAMSPAGVIPAYEELGKLWGLRMLVELGVVRKLFPDIDFGNDLFREVLELFELRTLLDVYDRCEGWEESSGTGSSRIF